jgi:hypothetical protein
MARPREFVETTVLEAAMKAAAGHQVDLRAAGLDMPLFEAGKEVGHRCLHYVANPGASGGAVAPGAHDNPPARAGIACLAALMGLPLV